MNSRVAKFRNDHSAPLANGRGSAQRGGSELQKMADQRPEAALQRQVQAWGDGSERVGQLRAWQGVADGRGVGGERQDLTAGFANSVVQREWIGEAFPKKWDQPLDAVQWYLESDNKIWYELLDEANSDFTDYAGKDNKRMHEEWTQLRQLSLAGHRIQKYHEQITEIESKRKKKEKKPDRGVETIKGEAKTPVLNTDTTSPVEKYNWLQVDDDFGSIKDKKVGEQTGRQNTKFFNMFHLNENGQTDAVIMMENFRETAREFFASDAFFNQWMRVLDKKSLLELPTTFPSYLYRNNISNETLSEQMREAFKEVEVGYLDVNYEDYKNTDNVKSTLNILKEYNNINALRGEAPSHISEMRIFKTGPAIRFTIEKK